MKAIVSTKYGPPNTLKLKEVPKPIPKGDEVLINVHSTSINDWDLALTMGTPFIMRLIAGLRKSKYDIFGVDVAGTVEAIGEKVTKFKIGNSVFGDLSESGFGAFAEYTCAKDSALKTIPPTMSFEQAAAIPHAATLAIQGLVDIGNIQKGQKILVNGAGGGVGVIAVQIAKDYDAQVTGVDTADKAKMMLAQGYDHVIDYRAEDFTRSGVQYDLILDAKTNRAPMAYTRALKPGGKYVTVGGTTSRLIQLLVFGPIISKIKKKKLQILALKANKGLDLIIQLFEEKKIIPVIDGPYALADIPWALQYFSEGKHKGKIIINMNDES